jgi:hypothetical protein
MAGNGSSTAGSGSALAGSRDSSTGAGGGWGRLAAALDTVDGGAGVEEAAGAVESTTSVESGLGRGTMVARIGTARLADVPRWIL